MKKLLLIIILLGSTICSQAQSVLQMVSATPSTQLEKINNEWTYTAPITFKYCLLYSLSNGVFVGGGVGGGVDLNGDGTGNVKFDAPATIFAGFQIAQNIPAFSLGWGGNLASGNQILEFGIHFTSFNIPAANARYKSIASSDAYDRNSAGFNRDK